MRWIVLAALALVAVASNAAADAGATVDVEPESTVLGFTKEKVAAATIRVENRAPTGQDYEVSLQGATPQGWVANATPTSLPIPGLSNRTVLVTFQDLSPATNGTLGTFSFTLRVANERLSDDADEVWINVTRYAPQPGPNDTHNHSGTADQNNLTSSPQAPPGDAPPPGESGGGDAPLVRGTVSPWAVTAAVGGLGLAGLALTLEPVRFRLTALALALFTRLERGHVLDQASRGRLYEWIQQHPGVHYAGLRADLSMRNGVLTHHLVVLMREGFVHARQEGMRKRFYPSGHPATGPPILSPVARALCAAIGKAPGQPMRDLGRDLGLSKQIVSYHIGCLTRAGMVRIQRDGRAARCYPR